MTILRGSNFQVILNSSDLKNPSGNLFPLMGTLRLGLTGTKNSFSENRFIKPHLFSTQKPKSLSECWVMWIGVEYCRAPVIFVPLEINFLIKGIENFLVYILEFLSLDHKTLLEQSILPWWSSSLLGREKPSSIHSKRTSKAIPVKKLP